MKKLFFRGIFSAIVFFLLNTPLSGQRTPVIYLIPGQGSDARIFKNLTLDPSFELKYVNYVTPDKGMTMRDYAIELSQQIDTSRSFILIGVSLGGMLATEMNDFLHPEMTIIISSAKSRAELPRRYTFQEHLPIYKLVSAGMAKHGAKIMQPIVEPDRNRQKALFKSMIADKDPLFLKRTIKMILEWDRVRYSDDIIHIHGDNDHTIPIRNVHCDYVVHGGSHMMVATRYIQMSALLNKLLSHSLGSDQ